MLSDVASYGTIVLLSSKVLADIEADNYWRRTVAGNLKAKRTFLAVISLQAVQHFGDFQQGALLIDGLFLVFIRRIIPPLVHTVEDSAIAGAVVAHKNQREGYAMTDR